MLIFLLVLFSCMYPSVICVYLFDQAAYYTLLFTARCCTGYRAIPQHFTIYCCLQPDVVQGTVPYLSTLYHILLFTADVVQGTVPYLSTLLYIVVYSQMLYRVPCHTSALYTIYCCLQPMLYRVACHTSALYYTLLFTARCCTGYHAIPQDFTIYCCLQPMLYRVPCHT